MRVPEPALIRSLLVAITGVAAFVLGREVSTEWVETLTMLYTLAAPVLAGLLIRPVVQPDPARYGPRPLPGQE